MAAAQKAQDLSALERATKPWTVGETGKQLPDCFAALKVAGCPTSSRLRAQEQLRRCRTAMHKRTNTLWAMANEGKRLPAVIETLCKAAAQKSRRRSAMHKSSQTRSGSWLRQARRGPMSPSLRARRPLKRWRSPMLKDWRTRAGPVPRRVGAFEALCKAAARAKLPSPGMSARCADRGQLAASGAVELGQPSPGMPARGYGRGAPPGRRHYRAPSYPALGCRLEVQIEASSQPVAQSSSESPALHGGRLKVTVEAPLQTGGALRLTVWGVHKRVTPGRVARNTLGAGVLTQPG